MITNKLPQFNVKDVENLLTKHNVNLDKTNEFLSNAIEALEKKGCNAEEFLKKLEKECPGFKKALSNNPHLKTLDRDVSSFTKK